jgi:hypothetical protein
VLYAVGRPLTTLRVGCGLLIISAIPLRLVGGNPMNAPDDSFANAQHDRDNVRMPKRAYRHAVAIALGIALVYAMVGTLFLYFTVP